MPWLDWPDDGAQGAGLARQHGRRIRAGEDRARLDPLLDDGLLGAREVGAGQRQQRDGAGQVARVVDRHAGVDDRRELAGARPSPRRVDLVDGDWLHLLAHLHVARERAEVVADDEEGVAGRRQQGLGLGDPHDDDPVAVAALGDGDEAAAVDRAHRSRRARAPSGARRPPTPAAARGIPASGPGSPRRHPRRPSRRRGPRGRRRAPSSAGALAARCPTSTGLCGEVVCGSHLRKSQSARRARPRRRRTRRARRASGAPTAWTTSDRAASRAPRAGRRRRRRRRRAASRRPARRARPRGPCSCSRDLDPRLGLGAADHRHA